jgi:hypothetical protein
VFPKPESMPKSRIDQIATSFYDRGAVKRPSEKQHWRAGGGGYHQGAQRGQVIKKRLSHKMDLDFFYGRVTANLKVHKNENFFGSDFDFCTNSLLVMFKYEGFVKKIF